MKSLAPVSKRLALLVVFSILFACGESEGENGETDNGETPNGEAESCFVSPESSNRPRHIVVSHPYDEDGNQSNRYGVLLLDEGGGIVALGHQFSMGRSNEGEIHFTPDGSLGFVVQSDGSIGIFRLDEDGVPEVVSESFTGDFYAGSLVLDSHHERLYVLDLNWENNGGALSTFDLDCEGTLTLVSKVPSRLARGMALLEPYPGRGVIVSRAFGGEEPDGHEARLLDLLGEPEPVALSSTSLFPDDEAVFSAVAATPDGAYVLVGDNSGFSSVPNRVAIAAIEGDEISYLQTISPIEDPADIVISPFGDAAIVTSGFGDAIHVIAYDPTTPEAPFSHEGELDYQGLRPGIPVSAVGIERGSLMGHVLVAEYNGIRQVVFEGEGRVVDLGPAWTGEGMAEMIGAIGVQP